MSTKLVIENREFYFHPTHQAYAGSIDGCVVHVVTRDLKSKMLPAYA